VAGGAPHSPRHQHGHPQVRAQGTEALGQRPLKDTCPPRPSGPPSSPAALACRTPSPGQTALSPRVRREELEWAAWLHSSEWRVFARRHSPSKCCARAADTTEQGTHSALEGTSPVPAVLPTPARPPYSPLGHVTQRSFRGAVRGVSWPPARPARNGNKVPRPSCPDGVAMSASRMDGLTRVTFAPRSNTGFGEVHFSW